MAITLVCVCSGGLALGSGTAQAAIGHQYLAQLTGFSSPSGAAVNDVSGWTLVPDSGTETVDVFDSSGQRVATWDGSAAKNPPGTPARSFAGGLNVAANNTTGDVYVSESANNVVDILSSTGGYLGQLTDSTGTTPFSFGSAGPVAVDQATGNVYVADTGVGIDVFNSSGAFTGTLPGYSCSFTCSVAVDGQAGAVLVGDQQTDVINVFDAATGALTTTWTGSGTPAGWFGNQFVWVAADDRTGHAFVAETTDEVVDELDSSGNYLGQLTGVGTPPSGSFGLAGVGVGQASGDVYVTANGVVDIFGPDGPDAVTGPATNIGPTSATLNGTVNPGGAAITDCHFAYVDAAHYNPAAANPYAGGGTAACATTPVGSSPVPVSAAIGALAPGTTYDVELYASESGGGTTPAGNVTFQTPPPPVVDSASATNLTASSATLNAQINPEGLDTTYHFEYGTSSGYGASIPVPDAHIAPGTSDVSVSQPITGLSPNTEYHWRVVATNASGTTTGVDHTFVYSTAGGLPDNRGYEQVTPVQKNGATIERGLFILPPSVSLDGDRAVAHSISCFGGAAGCTASRNSEGEPYLFTRSSTGWVTTPLALPDSLITNAPGAADDGGFPDAGNALFSASTPPAGEDDWWVTKADGSAVDLGPVWPPADGPGAKLNHEVFQAASPDFSRFVYGLDYPAWPGSGTGPAAYEYVGSGNSQPQLVGVTGGAGSTDLISTCGTAVASVSSDASTVIFNSSQCASGSGANSGSAVPANQLWARIDASRSVLLSDRSPADCTTQACLSSAPEDATFFAASPDGSKVLFTSTQQLTDQATQGSPNLYEYDFSNPAGHELSDLSAPFPSGEGPGNGTTIAISPDLSHVYFVASDVESAAANSQGDSAQSGANNLYVYEHDARYPSGHLAFVARLSSFDAVLGGRSILNSGSSGNANVTPDGRFLVLASHNDLTADDISQTGAAQAFRYDAQTDQLTRVSIGSDGFNDNGNTGGASVCAGQSYGCTADAVVAPARFARLDPSMSDDGSRVFFESPLGLTPGGLNLAPLSGATTYAENVYEWEMAGTGSCPPSTSAGCVYLISDGKDLATNPSNYYGSDVVLIGSDSTGENVFFGTSDALVPQDTDTEFDIYDARVGGGFPYTPPNQCTADTCQGAPSSPPPPPFAGSVTFSGPGNPASARSSTPKVKVLSRVVHGTTFLLTVKVPVAGRITITGAGIKRVSRFLGRGGTYRLRVSLTPSAKGTLACQHVCRLRVRVTYAPVSAAGSAATVPVTVKPALRARHARRTSTLMKGGAR